MNPARGHRDNDERPAANVVLIIIDTLRRDSVACYNERPPWGPDFPPIRTPNLDAFAAQAVQFDRAFPESLPSLSARSALYTARRAYPFRLRSGSLLERHFTASGFGPLPEDDPTLSEAFREAGFRTALISDLYHQFKPSMNYTRGFDQWTFIRGQECDNYRSGPRPTLAETLRYIPLDLLALREESDVRADIHRPEVPYWAAALVRNFRNRFEEEHWTSAKVFSTAVDWLRENRDVRTTGEGVFLTVECFDPHEPWFVPVKYRELYAPLVGQDNVVSPYAELSMDHDLLRNTRANYAGLVTMVDHWFGVLLAELLDGGWLEDTIVAVVADHGHSLERGYVGKRGYPAEPEVFRVPMLLRLPGRLRRGSRYGHIVQHHDLAATLLESAAVPLPPGADGQSLLTALRQRAYTPVRDHAVVAWGPALLVVDDEWWLSVKVDGSGAVLRRAADPTGPNLAAAHPRVARQLYERALNAADHDVPAHLLAAAAAMNDVPEGYPVSLPPGTSRDNPRPRRRQ